MKKYLSNLLFVLACFPSLAFAAGEPTSDGSFLITLFIGFFALIVVFQLVPAVILFVGMLRGLLTRDQKAEKHLS